MTETKNTFRILFYIKRNALLRNGSAPIMGRITINGERAQFSTRLSSIRRSGIPTRDGCSDAVRRPNESTNGSTASGCVSNSATNHCSTTHNTLRRMP